MANVDKLNEGKLIKRSKRVSFMNVGTTDEPKYIRLLIALSMVQKTV